MSDLFSDNTDPQIDPNKDYLPELVGEGKKFKDPSGLAFAVVNANAHIAKLEKENQTHREELQRRSTVEEVLEKISKARTGVETPGNHSEGTNRPDVLDPAQLEAKIAELVATTVQKTTAQTIAQQNITAVKSSLKEAWGDGYQDKLDAVGKELGLGKEWMNNLAAERPEAFMALVGAKAPVRKGGTAPFEVSPSGINAAALSRTTSHSGEKTAKYYRELQQKDPVAYRKNEKTLHAEQMAQALKLGESYFD